jgi:hypothetical protein
MRWSGNPFALRTMKNELHPIELLILALLLVASAVRELLVAVIALVIVLAEWRRPRPAIELSGISGQLPPVTELPRNPRQLPPAPAAPPHVNPLHEELVHLPTRRLMELAGTRSKKHRRMELIAMIAA